MDNDAGKLSFRPEVSYMSSHYWEVFNTPRIQQDGYALLALPIAFGKIRGKELRDQGWKQA